MHKKAKKIAVLNVTARCDSACKFCFGPARHVGTGEAGRPEKEPTTFTLLRRIFELHQKGVEMIIFTGGEPLLRQDIWELIEFAKRLGIFTVLHTNGKKLKSQMSKVKTTTQNLKLKERLKYLDQINLPLDGYDAKTNDVWRGRGHFNAVMSILRLLKNMPIRGIISIRPIRVIISTVATAKNAQNVPKIGRILPQWIYKWRVFQFKPMGKARKVRREFALSDREFGEVARRVMRSFPRHNQNYVRGQDDRKFKAQCVGTKDRKFWEGYGILNF